MLYAFLSIVFFFVQNLSNKEYARRFSGGLGNLCLFDGCALSMAALALFITGGFHVQSPPETLYALGFGILFVATIFLIVICMAKGPMGLTALIINMSMMIPVLYGILFLKEELTWMKIAGVAAMVAVLAVNGLAGGGGKEKGSGSWFALTVLAMISNGFLSLMQKGYTLIFPTGNVVTQNAWAFAIGAVLCFFGVCLMRARKFDYAPAKKRIGEILMLAAGMGIGTAGGNSLLTMSLPYLPNVVVYPLVQGTVIIVLMLGSVLIYKDKMTKAAVFSLVAGLAGIVLLSLS